MKEQPNSVDIPPASGLIGLFVGLWRFERVDIGKILSSYDSPDVRRVSYRIYTGPDKGNSFSSGYGKQYVYTFKSLREAKEYFGVK